MTKRKKNSPAKPSSFPYVPHELQNQILEKLPVKSLLRFKCVCKSWLFTIENPKFARKQLENSKRSDNKPGEIIFVQIYNSDSCLFYSVNTSSCQVRSLEPPFDIPIQYYLTGVIGTSVITQEIKVCTCDGLLLLSQIDEGTLFLWNPSTNKFREIPPPPSSPPPHKYLAHGFGYDSSIQSYKIIIINRTIIINGTISYPLEVQVFTVKTNSWRTVQCFRDSKEIFHFQRTLLINGAVYFLGQNIRSWKDVILCFNLAEEKFTRLPSPLSELPPVCELKIFEGHGHIHYSDGRTREFWVRSMMQYNNSKARIRYHPDSSTYTPHSLMKNGEPDYLRLLDISNKVKENGIQKEDYGFEHSEIDEIMHSYVESLVAP